MYEHPPLEVGHIQKWISDNKVPQLWPIADAAGHPFRSVGRSVFYPLSGPARLAIAFVRVPNRAEAGRLLTVAVLLAFIQMRRIDLDAVLINQAGKAFRDLGQSSYHADDGRELPALQLRTVWG